MRNDDIFISRHNCDNLCPAGPPGPKGSPGRRGPSGRKGSSGIKGAKGDPGVATSVNTIRTTISSTFTTIPYSLQSVTKTRKELPQHSALPGYSCGEYFDTFEDATRQCKKVLNDCHLLIEYTIKGDNSGRPRKLYELGRIDRNAPRCPYNAHMTAKVIWSKNKL